MVVLGVGIGLGRWPTWRHVKRAGGFPRSFTCKIEFLINTAPLNQILVIWLQKLKHVLSISLKEQ